MATFRIEGIGAISTGALPSGDMTVWSVGTDQIIEIVKEVCTGRGYWKPEYRNWIIFAKFADTVIAGLKAVSTERLD